VNAIELAHGRVREERWGDRTLDIDIVTMDGIVQSSESLTLPHPRASERAFVLVPWLDVDPDAELPGFGRVDAIVASLDAPITRYPAEGRS
jgi:7,8-dihydro-6-hydroxymethylpterin-pyrophosphokinase